MKHAAFSQNYQKYSLLLSKILEIKSYFLLGVPLPVYGWYHVKIQVSADPRVLSIYRKWDTQKEIWFFKVFSFSLSKKLWKMFSHFVPWPVVGSNPAVEKNYFFLSLFFLSFYHGIQLAFIKEGKRHISKTILVKEDNSRNILISWCVNWLQHGKCSAVQWHMSFHDFLVSFKQFIHC